jgi:hypothetical protein
MTKNVVRIVLIIYGVITCFFLAKMYYSSLWGIKYIEDSYGNTDNDFKGAIIEIIVILLFIVILTRFWKYDIEKSYLRLIFPMILCWINIVISSFLGHRGGEIITLHIYWLLITFLFLFVIFVYMLFRRIKHKKL